MPKASAFCSISAVVFQAMLCEKSGTLWDTGWAGKGVWVMSQGCADPDLSVCRGPEETLLWSHNGIQPRGPGHCWAGRTWIGTGAVPGVVRRVDVPLMGRVSAALLL